MHLTYQEFLKLVPDHTSSFVIHALPVLDCYVKKNFVQMNLNNGNTKLIEGENSVPLTVLFHIYYHMNSKYATILTKYGYVDEKLTLNEQTTLTEEITLEKLFQDYGHFFCIYQKVYNYQALTPTAIIENFIQENSYSGNYEYNLNATKLFSEKFSKIHQSLQKFRKEEANEIIDEIKKEFTQNLPIEIINYFETTSIIHQILNQTTDLSPYIKSTEDIQVISLFLSFFHSIGTTEIKTYLNHFGLIEENIEGKCFEKTFLKKETDYLLLNFYYTKFKKQSIEKIITLLTDREFTKSWALEQLLKEQNLDIVILNVPIKEILKRVESKQFLNSLTPEVKNFLENATKIYSILQKHITNTTNYNINLIIQKEDITLLSIIIALFKENNDDYTYFLVKNGITLQTLAESLEIDLSLFQNLNTEKPNYQILTDEYLPTLEEKKDLKINDILKSFLDKSPILEKIMHKLNKNYSILETEIKTSVEQIPSLEERYQSLANLEVPIIDIHSSASIVYFGNELSNHSQFINMKTSELQESREIDKSSNLIKEITSKLNPSSSKKRNLLSIKSFLISRKKQTPFSLTENNENLERTINKSINKLQEEISEYEQILNYLGLYYQKTNEHLIRVIEAIDLRKEENSLNNSQNPAFLVGDNNCLNFLEDKKNTFEIAISYITSEIFRIGQIMRGHSLSLKSLNISKQDLIPLAKAELTFIESSKNEAQALTIYTNILNLCQNLYSQNIDGIKSSMEIFRPNMAENTFIKIESDVNNYLLQLQSTSTTENNNTTRKLI